MKRISLVFVVGSIALALTPACSKKPQECKSVVDIIDDDDQALQVAAAGLGPDPAQTAKAMADVATVETKLAANLKALTITSPDVKKGSDDYAAAATEGADAFNKLSAPLAKLAGSSAAGTDPFTRITAAVDAMVAHCKATPGPDCVTLGQELQKIPKNSDNPSIEAQQLTAWMNEMKALPITDASLKGDVTTLDGVIQDVIDTDNALSGFVTGIQTLKVKTDAATAEIKTACNIQ